MDMTIDEHTAKMDRIDQKTRVLSDAIIFLTKQPASAPLSIDEVEAIFKRMWALVESE